MSAAAGLLARRSNSTTSLAQFYQEHNPNYERIRGNGEAPELDFCNAFWGEGDAGFEVLMARLRASARTIDDLKVFMKERANIEQEYGKKLAKLAKQTLGKDETGELRAALEALRVETDKQSGGRLKLAGEVRKDVELPIQDMANKLGAMRKNYQSNIEKLHKSKLSQEALVAKTRERYEQDCLRINSYTANTSLVQGKDLEKLHSKLEKVQQTVGGNEREYKTSVKALEETTRKWEVEWKTFCDHVQDLEEERINFIKDNAWNLANAISSVCVTDDESCERIRVALEGFEDVTEIEAFVRGYGTGAKIPDPPLFIDYARGQAYHNDQTARVANFQRATNRSGMSLPTSALMSNDKSATFDNGTPDDGDKTVITDRPVSRGATAASNPPPIPAQKPSTPSSDSALAPEAVPPKTGVPMSAPAPVALASPMVTPRPPSAFGRPPSVFGHLPPAQTGPSAIRPSASSAEEDDPLARQLAELRRDPPPAGSIRRGNSVRRPGSVTGSVNSSHQYRSKSPGLIHPQSQPRQTPQESQAPKERQQPPPQHIAQQRQSYQSHAGRPSTDTSLVPPTPGHTAAELAQSKADHERRNSRQFPLMQEQGYNHASDDFGNRPTSRPGSVAGHAPRAPTPVFMQPPVIPAATVADQVLDQYHQALPGERSRSRAGTANSRPGSRMGGSFSGELEPAQTLAQPPRQNSGREGFVGIGAGGRSPSPQPGAYQSLTSPPVEQARSTTPGGSWNATNRYSQSQGPGSSQPGTLQRPHSQSTRYSIHGNPNQSSQAVHDQRQSMYGANQSPAPQPQFGSVSGQSAYGSATANSRYGSVTSPVNLANQHGSIGSLAAHPSQTQYAGQHATSPATHNQAVSQTSMYGQAPMTQSPTGFPPPGQPAYQRAPSTQPGYAAANAAQNVPYTMQPGQYRPSSTAPAPLNIPTQYQAPVSPAPVVQSPHQQQPNQYYNAAPQSQAGYAPQGQFAATNYGLPAGQQQRPAQEQPVDIARAASPQPPPVPTETPPTGQYSTTGQPVLFYVKALYDYQAQSDSEFDFQEGDIIAVTATPPDGWWSGELLDEARRLPGRTDFPSNFVTLF